MKTGNQVGNQSTSYADFSIQLKKKKKEEKNSKAIRSKSQKEKGQWAGGEREGKV